MNAYKKFLAITLFAALLFAAAYGGGVFLFFRAPFGYKGEGFWLYNCAVKKEAIAQSVYGPKIVFTGGSGTLFGIRAADVQARYGVPSVNAALHASLQADYLLYNAGKIAHSGDTVIFPVEYELLNYDGEYDQIRSFYLRTFDRGYFMRQPLIKILDDLYNTTPADILGAVKKWIVFEFLYERQEAPVGANYTSQTLNANGDETYNVGNARMREVMKTARPFALPSGEFKETEGLAAIKRFAALCRRNNVRFYVSYANTVYFDKYESDEYRRYYAALADYFARNDISVIGAPSNFFYDASYFYDTKYHLNRDGVTIRTRQLMEMMEEMKLMSPPRGGVAVGNGYGR